MRNTHKVPIDQAEWSAYQPKGRIKALALGVALLAAMTALAAPVSAAPVISPDLIINAATHQVFHGTTTLAADRDLIIEGVLEVVPDENGAASLILVAGRDIVVRGTILLPDGEDAVDLVNDGESGGDGGNGGSLVATTGRYNGTITLEQGSTVRLGKGGEGAAVYNSAPDSNSYGGHGGHAGVAYFETSRLVLDGEILQARGGDGGLAIVNVTTPGADSGDAVGGAGGHGSGILAVYDNVSGSAISPEHPPTPLVHAMAVGIGWSPSVFGALVSAAEGCSLVTACTVPPPPGCDPSTDCDLPDLVGAPQLPGDPGLPGLPDDITLGFMPGAMGLPSNHLFPGECGGGKGADGITIAANGEEGDSGGEGPDAVLNAGRGGDGGKGGDGGSAGLGEGGEGGDSFDCRGGDGGIGESIGGKGGKGGIPGNGGDSELGRGGDGGKGGAGGNGGDGGDSRGGSGGHSWFDDGGDGGNATTEAADGGQARLGGTGGTGLNGGNGGPGGVGGSGGSTGTAKGGEGGCGFFDEGGPGGSAIIEAGDQALGGGSGSGGQSHTSPLLHGIDGPAGPPGISGVNGLRLPGEDGVSGAGTVPLPEL